MEGLTMIKTKNDLIEIVNGLKNGNFLNYETDNNIYSIGYDNDTDRFTVKLESKVSRFKSNGSMLYEVIIEKIWLDRKYINKLVR
jgi:hypothetical protein